MKRSSLDGLMTCASKLSLTKRVIGESPIHNKYKVNTKVDIEESLNLLLKKYEKRHSSLK